MTTPIRATEATLMEVRQALQRIELFRRQIFEEIETPLVAHNADKSNPHTVGVAQAVAGGGGTASPVTKGALLAFSDIIGDFGDWDSLAPGTTGQVLVPDTGEDLGLKWDQPKEIHYTLLAAGAAVSF